ncbi:MAG TPA: glycosyltransferase [Candidatus Bathyarchaeia archaeon]|nr:glycosyltransferase [Candidatus Bathyarchaeia archaeon]
MGHKVLHVIYSLYRGGAERLIETEIIGSDRRRFEHLVSSITSGGDMIDLIANAGAHVYIIGKRRRGDLTAVTKLASVIRAEKVDLLHLHNAPGMFWGTLGQIMSGSGVPIVRTEHNPYIPEQLPLLYRHLYPLFTRRAAKVICVSALVRSSYVAAFPELAAKYVEIPNGIRVADFANPPPRAVCRAQLALPAEGQLIGTVGRLEPVKNQRLLIEAFSRVRSAVPEARLAILGEGTLHESLVSYAAGLGVRDRVSIVRETQRIDCFYGAIDVFCLSSDSEGMPLTILEAFASGVPVVSTAVGGIPEVIEDGKSGYLVPKGSAEGLAARLVEILMNPAKASELAANERAMARERFSAEKMVKATEAVYEEVLNRSASRARP